MAEIHVGVSDEQKERWQDYVDDHPVYSDMSTFVRHCVEKEISED